MRECVPLGKMVWNGEVMRGGMTVRKDFMYVGGK